MCSVNKNIVHIVIYSSIMSSRIAQQSTSEASIDGAHTHKMN